MDNHIVSFLQDCVVGVISTCKNDEIHSAPVYYYFDESDKAFYFITKSHSNKIYNIQQNRKVSFSIYSETLPRVFNASCMAEIFDATNRNKSLENIEIIRKLVEVHSTREYYPSPISSIKDGELRLVKLKVLDHHYKSYLDTNNQEQAELTSDRL